MAEAFDDFERTRWATNDAGAYQQFGPNTGLVEAPCFANRRARTRALLISQTPEVGSGTRRGTA